MDLPKIIKVSQRAPIMGRWGRHRSGLLFGQEPREITPGELGAGLEAAILLLAIVTDPELVSVAVVGDEEYPIGTEEIEALRSLIDAEQARVNIDAPPTQDAADTYDAKANAAEREQLLKDRALLNEDRRICVLAKEQLEKDRDAIDAARAQLAEDQKALDEERAAFDAEKAAAAAGANTTDATAKGGEGADAGKPAADAETDAAADAQPKAAAKPATSLGKAKDAKKG